MSVIAAAIIGSAVVGAGSSILASKAQSKSAQRGIDAQERTARQSLNLQKVLAKRQRKDFAPWRNIGKLALRKMWRGVESGEFSMDDFQFEEDPGYQFRLQQGIDALDASASARGRLLSGAQKKNITEYGQDYASGEYANAYARERNERARKFNILSGISGAGQASAAGQAAATGQLAETSSNILSGLGRSYQQGYQQIGAARASGYQGVGQSINQAAQNWLTYRLSAPAPVVAGG